MQFDFGDASNNYHGFGYQKSLWEYARWKKEPAARTNGPLTIAGPSATGAWFVDMSYRGSCDTVEEVQVPIGASYVNNPRTRTVQQARRITDWSKPAKVIMLVEGEAPRTPHARCSTLASASANFIPGECFRYSEDLAPLLKSLQIPVAKRIYGPSWTRHDGNTNYLFMDGHVERLLPKDAGEIANDWQKYLAYY